MGATCGNGGSPPFILSYARVHTQTVTQDLSKLYSVLADLEAYDTEAMTCLHEKN
jgi:hypothetical protein